MTLPSFPLSRNTKFYSQYPTFFCSPWNAIKTCSRDIDHLLKNAAKKLLNLVWSQFMTSLILVHNGQEQGKVLYDF